MYWINLTLRWFHIVAAIAAVGGTIFMRYALVPSVAVLTDEQRKALHEQVRSRWAKFVAASIAILLVTGLVNFFIFLQDIRTPAWAQWKESSNALYQAVFGVKFLIALVIFFIASALTGRSEVFKPIRQNAKMWMTLNVALALIVVALSGVLRLTHIGPTLTTTTITEPTGGGGG